MNNIINISDNLKSYYKRADGKIAGPFKINVGESKKTYWDLTNEELYLCDGTLFNGGIDERLIEEIQDYRKSFVKVNLEKSYFNRDMVIINFKKDFDSITDYTIDGLYIGNNNLSKSNRDLILPVTNETMKMKKFIDYYNDMLTSEDYLEIINNEDEEMCYCDTCEQMRKELSLNGETFLSSLIKDIYNKINNFISDDVFNGLFDFEKVSVSTQIQFLEFLINFYGEFCSKKDLDLIEKSVLAWTKSYYNDDIDDNIGSKKFNKVFDIETDLYEDVEIIKLSIVNKIIELQQNILKSKNIILIIDINKLLKFDLIKFETYFDSLKMIVSGLEPSKKLISIKPKPIIANTSSKEIEKYGFFSDFNINDSKVTILNPNYIFSIRKENGIIKEVIPIMRKK